jgi:hypothetical protein
MDLGCCQQANARFQHRIVSKRAVAILRYPTAVWLDFHPISHSARSA